MLVQNYGWPTGPAKIWLWLARRPFGWPRATRPAGSTTPVVESQTLKSTYSISLLTFCIKTTGGIILECPLKHTIQN